MNFKIKIFIKIVPLANTHCNDSLETISQTLLSFLVSSTIVAVDSDLIYYAFL